MASRFNIVGKANKLKTEQVADDQLEEEVKKTQEKQQAKKKMMFFMGIIVGLLCLILLILFVSSLFIKKVYSYEEIETVIKNASVSYFKDHPDLLPQMDGGIVEIEVDNLVSAEKMKPLTEYTKEGVLCTGRTLVEKAGDEYLYTPYLDCGENFTTVELYKKVTEKVVTSGYGLYKLNNDYVYRGENVDNYVQLDEGLWRIVKINSNNRIMLIKELSVGNPLAWDNRYNSEIGYSSGINNYSASRVKEYIDKIYDNPKENLNEVMLSSNDKQKIVAYTLCTGKRDINEKDNSRNIECSQVLNNQKVGLLSANDYINASVDSNCNSLADKSCSNYNYLKEKYNWWLVTASTGASDKVYSITDNGRVSLLSAVSFAYVRPVIYLNNKVLYKSGTGTKEDPFILK